MCIRDRGGARDDVVMVCNFSNVGYASYGIGLPQSGMWPVSYTHLDVYKRQEQNRVFLAEKRQNFAEKGCFLRIWQPVSPLFKTDV